MEVGVPYVAAESAGGAARQCAEHSLCYTRAQQALCAYRWQECVQVWAPK
jgi:hypothetical protein